MPNKGGRPRAVINQTEFEKLCGLQCTKEEICGWFSITDKTLERWCRETYSKGFSEVFREKRQRGKIALRRSQFQLAEKSASMGIWLGKQYLDQHDEDIMASAEASNGVLEAILALERNGVKQ